MSAWWSCRVCETANTTANSLCDVCDEPEDGVRPGVGLKGDLVRRLRTRATASRFVGACPTARPAVTRRTWQQRLKAEARWFYDRWADVARALS